MTETEIKNKVKAVLYKKLSYTSQDYDSILTDIIRLFKDSDGLDTDWDNISEADIMFIYMSLLAAHKDMLNYMIDYRVQESFMSTAKEAASLSRIAKSFGYKIPGLKAAYAQFTVESEVEIASFTTIVDDNNVAWTYSGEDATIAPGDTIDLYQGSKVTMDIAISDFNNASKARIIGAYSTAIGNNANANGVSSLVLDDGTEPGITFTEVDNLYFYNDDSDYVYSLAIDPDGLLYIQLPKLFDLNNYDSDAEFTFNYVITNGASTSEATTFSNVSIGGDYTVLTPVSDSFVAGSNMPSVDDIREAFKNHYASVDTLVTLEDYKNYILNVQKIIPDVTKCIVVDASADTSGEFMGADPDDDLELDALQVVIYMAQGNNQTVAEVDLSTMTFNTENIALLTALKEDLESRAISMVEVVSTPMSTYVKQPAYSAPLSVNLESSASLTSADEAAVKTIVNDYISSLSFNEDAIASELASLLSDEGYDYFSGGITFTSELETDVTTAASAQFIIFYIDSLDDITIIVS